MRSVIADATNEAYAVRIAKGAGLIAETRDLLRTWQPGESAAALAERVLKTDFFPFAVQKVQKLNFQGGLSGGLTVL